MERFVLFAFLGFWVLSSCSSKNDFDGVSAGSAKAVPVIVGGSGPDGSLNPGESAELTWDVTADQPSVVYIEASYDGVNWFVIEESLLNSGKYTLKTPDIPGAKFRVRVTDGNEGVIAASDEVVISGTVRTIALEGETNIVAPGSKKTLTWEVGTDAPSIVDIQFSNDGGESWNLIETTVNDGTEEVTIPDLPGQSITIRVYDNEKKITLAESSTITISTTALTGVTGFGLSAGGLAKAGGYRMHFSIGEPISQIQLKNNVGTVRIKGHFSGVTE